MNNTNDESEAVSQSTQPSHHYDLTTPNKVANSLGKLKRDFSKSLSDATNRSLNIAGNSIAFTVKAVQSAIDSLTQFVRISEDIKQQAEAAKEIIEAGAKSNVDEIEITLSQKAGANLIYNLKYQTEVTLGKKGTMTIKVKYKDKKEEKDIVCASKNCAIQ